MKKDIFVSRDSRGGVYSYILYLKNIKLTSKLFLIQIYLIFYLSNQIYFYIIYIFISYIYIYIYKKYYKKIHKKKLIDSKHNIY